jgi:hypothetical protein
MSMRPSMAASQGFNLTRLALAYVLITIWRKVCQ